ncbi:ketohydroxyglutarate aldolase [Nostoc sp. MBR 210]|nr:ketohydroxyglutarate aldolase [Nostoc sp. MBR 210]
MPKVNLSIVVDEKYRDQIHEVSQKLQTAGMKVEQILGNLGIITGSYDSEKIDFLSQVEGVTHVEPSREYKLAPPESDIQ